MDGVATRVVGVTALVLSAASLGLGFLNRIHHPRRFIGFIVICGVLLIAGIAVLVIRRRPAGAP